MNNLVADTNKMSVSPLVLLLGGKAFKFGLTKKIRDINERIDVFRAIARRFVDKRIQEVNEAETRECKDIISSLILSQKKDEGDEDIKGYSN